MCGLAGIFHPRHPGDGNLATMLETMHHRGPDGNRTWMREDGRYQCGFARLAIIDLKGANQPLVEANGQRVLMGNGEIYNYQELRRDPECADYPWKTHGDMEPILPLATALGDNFVHRLNGMFALALYESGPHRLTLVRDRLGIKPLYWSRLADGGLIFASEIKALFASGLVSAQVDQSAVGSYLSHGWISAPATLWRGVNKLAPGHMLVIDGDGSITIKRYWRPQPSQAVPRDTVDAARYLTDLLDDSIRLQLRSDVPLGALLSGGLDSGLLVALAAKRLDRSLKTYTVRFEGAAVDESPLAALVAKRFGTEHTCFDLGMGDIAAHLPRLAWFCDEPLADASLLPNHLIEDMLSREVRVALNGTGGDELFAGYGRYFPLPVEKRYLRLPPLLRQGLVEPLARRIAPMTAWRLQRAGKFFDDRGGYLHDHTTLFPWPILKMLDCPLSVPSAAQKAAFEEFDGPADTAALAADIQTYLPEDLLLLLDRTSMAASVEGRVPFLDHRLVEAALAVPPAIRTPDGRQKALERVMAEPLLPPELLAAPKQGFASPVAAWFRGGLREPVERLLTSRRALDRGWWSQQGIHRLMADPGIHGHRLYALTMLELTIRIHAEGQYRSPPRSLEELL